MTSISDEVETLERIHDLEEEVAFWRQRAEEFRDSALLLAEEASKCLVLAHKEQAHPLSKFVGLST